MMKGGWRQKKEGGGQKKESKICLILVGRGGNFEFLRDLKHLGLFWEKGGPS